MRLGQTSGIHFTSRIVSSAIGFLAMVYFARELGSGVLGTYFLVLMFVSWLSLFATMGVGGALQKRLSEGMDLKSHLGAGMALTGGLFLVLSVVVLVARGPINQYVGADVALFIIPLLAITLSDAVANSVLQGRHLVHVSSLLTPVKTASRSVLQVAAVVLGLGLLGLLGGYFAGLLVSVVLGVYVISIGPSLPRMEHVRSLIEYAKYSWFSQLQGAFYNWTDVAVLGFFVSSSLIGVYSIAWNIATFLAIFSSSISTSLFPEISKISATEETQNVAPLVTQSLTYAGLFGIPGLVGSLAVGPRLLRIYGPEFATGALVLQLLIAAIVVYSYQNQLLTGLNGIDRPDLSLRVNTTYVATNIVLNVVLVWQFGWTGAAVATLLSATLGTLLGYRYLAQVVSFTVPVGEVGRQVVAATLMGALVEGLQWANHVTDLTDDNGVIVLGSVAIGAAAYLAILLVISAQFRETVRENLPYASEVPGL